MASRYKGETIKGWAAISTLGDNYPNGILVYAGGPDDKSKQVFGLGEDREGVAEATKWTCRVPSHIIPVTITITPRTAPKGRKR